VHGDLKGANILISGVGSARLADFGLSSIVDSEILRWTSLKTMTRPGGTVRWQAPELMEDLAGGSRPTFSMDVYSFASVMYEVLTNRLPFYEIWNDAAVVLRVTKGFRPTRPPLDQAPELSNEIWEVMESCWNSNPIERPSVNQVAERLSRVCPTESTISRINMQKIQRKRDVGEDVPTPLSFRVAMRGQTMNFSKIEIDILEECARDSPQSIFPHNNSVKSTAASPASLGGSLSPPPLQEMASLGLFSPLGIATTDPDYQGSGNASGALGLSYTSTGVNNCIDSSSRNISGIDIYLPLS